MASLRAWFHGVDHTKGGAHERRIDSLEAEQSRTLFRPARERGHQPSKLLIRLADQSACLALQKKRFDLEIGTKMVMPQELGLLTVVGGDACCAICASAW